MKLRVGAVFIPVLDLETSIEWYRDRAINVYFHFETGDMDEFKNSLETKKIIKGK